MPAGRRLDTGSSHGAHARLTDPGRGTELLRPGDLLTPSRLGSIAALGYYLREVEADPET